MGDNQTFHDDEGEWCEAKLSDIFDSWLIRLLCTGALFFWGAVILSVFHLWAVPLKAVLVWGFRSTMLLVILVCEGKSIDSNHPKC